MTAPNTTRHSNLVHAGCLLLLLVTTVRLFALNRDEWKIVQATQMRQALVPTVGSLSGISASSQAAASGGDGYLLLFVLRSDRLAADIAYWNDVVRRVDRSPAPIQYWGVCDGGAACDAAQASAAFRIVGFLDPFEMRSVVNAHATGEVLLYDKLQVLNSRLARLADASRMADEIRKRVK